MPPKKAAAGAGKRRGAYNKAVELPSGEFLTDHRKQQWKLGKPFASGGFGQIYTCSTAASPSKTFCMKIEPAENGPLFQEIHVYCRIAKPGQIDEWKKRKAISFLGVPPLLGSGVHKKEGNHFRFLVMPLYGSDLESVRLKQFKGKLTPSVAFNVGLSCIDILEYLHDVQYVHADLKGENLLLERVKPKGASYTDREIAHIVLVDYGLARRLTSPLPQYKEVPNKGHDGTLLYTSLDAHKGCVPTFRTDVEILAYNLMLWLEGRLPWSNLENKPAAVQSAKERFKSNVGPELNRFLSSRLSQYVYMLTQFTEYAFSVGYHERPDYQILRSLLKDGLEDAVTTHAEAGLRRSVSPPKAALAKRKPISDSNTSLSSESLVNGVDSSLDSRRQKKPKIAVNRVPDKTKQKPCSSRQSGLIETSKLKAPREQNGTGVTTSRFGPARKDMVIPGIANLRRASIRRKSLDVRKAEELKRQATRVARGKPTGIRGKQLAEKPAHPALRYSSSSTSSSDPEYLESGTQTSPYLWPR